MNATKAELAELVHTTCEESSLTNLRGSRLANAPVVAADVGRFVREAGPVEDALATRLCPCKDERPWA